MPLYKFVHFPKEVKFAQVRDELNKRIECQIKNACRGGLFVRFEQGTLESFKIDEWDIDVAESRSVNDENWETLRVPRFLAGRRYSKPHNGENGEGETDAQDSNKQTSYPVRERRPRPALTAENQQAGQPPRQRDVYRAFVYSESVKPDAILAYFKANLNTQVLSIEVFEGKMHYYLTFPTLDDCRAARAAYRESPMEGVTVKPFMTKAMRARRPRITTD